VPEGFVPLKLIVSGLKGGHSGLDINLGRGNAGKLLFRFIKLVVREYDARLAEVNAGDLRNAIPREGYAIIVVPSENVENLKEAAIDFEKTVKSELSFADPDLKFVVEDSEMPLAVFDEASQDNVVDAINVCPNGVIRMSDEMHGMVETSTNLAIVRAEGGLVKIQCLIRSSVESAKKELVERFESLFSLSGAVIVIDGSYPGWKPNTDSPILKEMQGVYNKMYGKIPEVRGIHAGLECGLLGAVYPDWDMISFGPTIRFPHSPDEKVNIPSVKKFWDFLLETIKNVPIK
jgi:dipeptidase D